MEICKQYQREINCRTVNGTDFPSSWVVFGLGANKVEFLRCSVCTYMQAYIPHTVFVIHPYVKVFVVF